MPVFQVSSRSLQLAAPPRKRTRRLPSLGYRIARTLVGGLIGGLLFTLVLTVLGHPDTVFILLPVLVSLPLASQGELTGLLILGPHLKGEEYTHEERTMLGTLVPQVAPALRVAQLVQEQQVEVRERERIEQELRTAQDIQHAFLPKDVPALPGWQLVPYYQPAREVGGDFYDFLLFEDGRLGIVIGDVTDKGIPAALVMTATRTMLRTAAQEKASPCEVLARVNDLLYAEIPSRMFVTCFYAILDPSNGRMRYANAGHDLPYRRHQGGVSELWATGMPLGMMPGTGYEEHEITLAPAESLLFYSDGLVEAHNSRREMFGFPRLKTVLQEQGDGVPLIDLLLDELKRFTGEAWEQEDDVTLVTLQRTTESLAINEQQAKPHLLEMTSL
jgi:serine phosphatase RsbU (regulator of sigma subunit)